MTQQLVITTSSFADFDSTPLDLLRNSGFEVLMNPFGKALTTVEAAAVCRDAVGMIAGTEPLNSGFMVACPNLRVISRCGTGMDNIDLEAAERCGIKVLNTPDAPTLAVAELTVGLMLDLMRQISRQDSAIRYGEWKKIMGFQLSGKHVGFVGFGRIAQKIAELLSPFNCKIAFTDPAVTGAVNGVERKCLDELLAWVDIISIHASAKTPLIGSRELALVSPGTWLVNTARGCAVEETALLGALASGHLAGAALDVFAHEPYIGGMLCECKNVVLTPHIGSYARESRILMELESAQNLLKGLEGFL